MRKSILLTVALFLILSAAGRGADPDVDPDLQRYVDIAKNDTKYVILARTNALDRIGAYGAEAKSVVGDLQKLLTIEVDDNEKDFFLLHVVQALGSIGPGAKKAGPDLAILYGQNNNADLRKAILDAQQSIGKRAPLPLVPVPPKPPEPVAQDKIASLTKVLQDTTLDVSVRMSAARDLGILGKDLTADQKKTATDALNKIVADVNEKDAYLKAVAKTAVDQIPK